MKRSKVSIKKTNIKLRTNRSSQGKVVRRSGGVFRELQCEERVQKGKNQGLLWSVGLGGREGALHTLQPGRSTAALQIGRQAQTLED